MTDPRRAAPGRSPEAPRTTSASLPLWAVVAASAVVAFAATGFGLLVPAATLGPEAVSSVRLVGAGLVVAGLVALLVLRSHSGPVERRGQGPTSAALVSAATLMGLLTLMAMFAPTVAREDGVDPTGSASSGEPRVNPDLTGAPPPLPPMAGDAAGGVPTEVDPDEGVPPAPPLAGPDPALTDADSAASDLLGWLANLLLVLLLLGVLGIAVVGVPWGEEEAPASLDPSDSAAAEAGLAASLRIVIRSGSDDPGWRITAAYERLLAALTSFGAPRPPYEAPHEHLVRVLGGLGVKPEPMHRLADLYVRAQFSDRPVTEAHRLEAAQALEASLDTLRTAEPA